MPKCRGNFWSKIPPDFDTPENHPLFGQALDGKKLRHGGGVELVSAFDVKSGRWMGSVCTEAKSNEIPAARELLDKIDVTGKTVVFDALHTQHETARAVVFEGGGDYVFTVENNQQGLNNELVRLLDPQPFSPS